MVKQAEGLNVSSHSLFQVVLCHCFLNPSSGPLSFRSLIFTGQALHGLGCAVLLLNEWVVPTYLTLKKSPPST